MHLNTFELGWAIQTENENAAFVLKADKKFYSLHLDLIAIYFNVWIIYQFKICLSLIVLSPLN